MSENKKKNEKKPLFSKKKKTVKYPTRYYINLYKDETKGKSKYSFIALGVFIVFLALFAKFGIYDQVEKVNAASRAYNKAMDELLAVQQSNKEYEEVKKMYDEVTDWYMSEEEQKEVDKINVFRMLEDDMMPYVGIKSVQISGNKVAVQTGVTTLDVVSKFVEILQNDERNGFVTVTTANASNGKDQVTNDITANIQIVYVGASGTPKETDPDYISEAEMQTETDAEAENTEEKTEETKETENVENSENTSAESQNSEDASASERTG